MVWVKKSDAEIEKIEKQKSRRWLMGEFMVNFLLVIGVNPPAPDECICIHCERTKLDDGDMRCVCGEKYDHMYKYKWIEGNSV